MRFLLAAAAFFLASSGAAAPFRSSRLEAPTVSLPALPARVTAPDQRAFGVELEYRVSPPPRSGKAEDIPASAYAGALEPFARRFGLSDRALIGRYGKYGTEHRMAEKMDFDGRSWEAVPEEVEGRYYDGVEVVSPVLSPRRDEEALLAAHADMLAGGRYQRGLSSSAHLTFDVSDLIDEGGNASRLVDAILFIESHWAHVYAALSPVRYGTIVNHFSSPLSSAHPRLFEELAALPRKERTLGAVRELFQRYETAEAAAQGGHPGGVWKMHSANYAKLLDLTEAKQITAIEFRIADLAGPRELRKARRLLAALLASAPRDAGFTPSLPATRSLADLNAAVAGQDSRAYESFLRRLGLDPAEYPALGALGPLPRSAGSDEVAVAALKAAARATLPGGLRAELERASRPVDIIDALLASPVERERRLGAMALYARPDEEAVPRAARLAAEGDADVRRMSVALLGQRLDDPRAWAALATALRRDPDPKVRSTAMFAMSTKPERAAPHFMRVQDDPEGYNRDWLKGFLREWGVQTPEPSFWSRFFR